MSYDLHAVVTSWVAQELEDQAPGEDIGYWVTLNQVSYGPEATIYLQISGFSASQRTPMPFDEAHVRLNTRRALDKTRLYPKIDPR